MFGGVDKVEGKGYWLEVEKYFSKAHDLTLLGRYDYVDPGKDVDDNSRSQLTLGLVWPVQEWHGRWALELRDNKQDVPGTPSESFHDKQVAAELMLNF